MFQENTCSLILENVRDHAIMLLDPKGIIQYANQATAEMQGRPGDEIIGQSFGILYPENEVEAGKPQQALDIAAKRLRHEEEFWYIRPDGSRFWADCILTPIFDGNDTLTGYTHITRDLTGHKTAEATLRESEERSRLLIEAVRDYAIIRLDPKGYILSWNEGARRIKGYAAHEIIGKHFTIFYTREDLDSGKPRMELEVAAKVGRFEDENWRVRKNGTVFWANVIITALFNDRNELIGYGKVTRDLTERKHAEEALRASEEQYRLLINSVRDYGIFMLDERGRIISWNEGARRINGYTREEILGKHFSIFYTKEDLDNNKPEREIRIATAEGKYEEEGWRLRKNGERFWASVTITAVRAESGSLVGFSKVTRDLTERRESERILRESEERYRLLASKLNLVNVELESTNRELEQFTSIVSHDLQEPLRTINSYLQLIERRLKEKLDDETREFMSLTIEAGKRMRSLITSLLEYAQLGRLDIAFDEIDLDELLRLVKDNLQESIRSSGADIRIRNKVKTMHGNQIQLIQLIQNIVSNALKFRGQDRPRITISVEERDDEILFSISDNGIGIEKEYMEKIFKIFSRIHTRGEYPGTGIGLAVAKKIVQRHGGKIWVESEPGKGTDFFFTVKKIDQE